MTVSRFYFDVVTSKLAGSAKWRGGLADKFPEDSHVLKRAAERLTELAETKIEDVTPLAWAEIEPHLGKHYFSEVVRQASRTVGFKNNPRDINDFLEIAADIANQFALPVLAGGK